VPGARAAVFGYRVDQLGRPDPLDPSRRSADYRVWIDPAKTKWIALSTSTTIQTYRGLRVLEGPTGRLKPTPSRQISLTITDPHGRTVGPLMMSGPGLSDGQMIAQAVVFGQVQSAPGIVRAATADQLSITDESGIANDFVIAGGPGDFTLHFELSGLGDASPLFLLMDVRDDLPPEGVVSTLQSSNQVPAFYGALIGNANRPSGGGSSSPLTPTPPPPPEPIPEPATLGLVALGLGCLSALRRRRHSS
jgi:hypothetical protein